MTGLNGWGHSVMALASAIVGVAIVAVIVSRQSATSQVIQAAGQVFIGALHEAVSPITSG